MGRLSAIAKLHAFPKAEEHLMRRTTSGALVTVLGIITMAVLFLHELFFFLSPEVIHEMTVDSTPRGRQLDVVVDVSFPALPCALLSLDALDMSGKHEVDVSTNIFKVGLDRSGREIHKEGVTDLKEAKPEHKGQPKWNDSSHDINQSNMPMIFNGLFYEQIDFRAIEQTVTEMKEAMRRGEGCRIHGHLSVERVAGNFHFSVHGQSMFVLQKVFPSAAAVNVSHVIHSLGFGAEYPGIVKPLDDSSRIIRGNATHSEGANSGTFKYFLKVVPTEYISTAGRRLATNQYSVTEYFSPVDANSNSLPAVYFLYDLSPIAVTITEKWRNFLHFLTRLCAVLGGTFALTGMLDKWVYSLVKNLSPPNSRIRQGF